MTYDEEIRPDGPGVDPSFAGNPGGRPCVSTGDEKEIGAMKLSTRGRYALRMMLDIARFGKDGKPVSLSAVAERTDISRGYLEQVAMSLRTANLLKAVSGRFGGFRLANPAADITLGRIIEAAIGPINLVECVANPTDCMRSEGCECRQVYDLINRRITDVLDEYTLADLESGAFASTGAMPVTQTTGDGAG